MAGPDASGLKVNDRKVRADDITARCAAARGESGRCPAAARATRAAGRGSRGSHGGEAERVHRCGVIAAEVRAAQRKYDDVEVAAAHLQGMLDKPK
jgi:hypothetical protein